jgi:hypothetical protein
LRRKPQKQSTPKRVEKSRKGKVAVKAAADAGDKPAQGGDRKVSPYVANSHQAAKSLVSRVALLREVRDLCKDEKEEANLRLNQLADDSAVPEIFWDSDADGKVDVEIQAFTTKVVSASTRKEMDKVLSDLDTEMPEIRFLFGLRGKTLRPFRGFRHELLGSASFPAAAAKAAEEEEKKDE